jgi:hypothetical protein
MSKLADLSPWVNHATLRHLIRELRKHRKELPARKSEMASYLVERDELMARFKLHMDVLKRTPLNMNSPPES